MALRLVTERVGEHRGSYNQNCLHDMAKRAAKSEGGRLLSWAVQVHTKGASLVTLYAKDGTSYTHHTAL